MNQLFNRKLYQQAIIPATILFDKKQTNDYCEILAECNHQLGNYIEAVQYVNKASDIAPYAYASISNESYYDLCEKLYSDLGVDFKIV